MTVEEKWGKRKERVREKEKKRKEKGRYKEKSSRRRVGCLKNTVSPIVYDTLLFLYFWYYENTCIYE